MLWEEQAVFGEMAAIVLLGKVTCLASGTSASGLCECEYECSYAQQLCMLDISAKGLGACCHSVVQACMFWVQSNDSMHS